MKKIITINTLVFCSFLVLFISCNGLNTPANKGRLKNQTITVSIGDTVLELGEKIMVIFQDKNENYWFGGGKEGVYKYDGKSLVLFTKKEGLCSHAVIGIQEDKLGNIYFDTTEGVSKFDQSGEQKMTTLTVIDSDTTQNEWRLEQDDLWFRMGWTKNGPYRYDGEFLYHLEFPKTELADEFHAKYPNSSYSPYGIYNLYKDSKGVLWFGTTSLGVCRYDGKTISWLYERQLTKTANDGDFGIRSIIEDKEGYFWFCNTRYRYEILPNSTEKNETNYTDYRKENGIGKSNNNDDEFPYYMSIAEDNNGDLWMATYDDGIWRNNGKELVHYPIRNGDTDVLLFSIYKDKQGVLWLGTQNAGVYKYNGKVFEKFTVHNNF